MVSFCEILHVSEVEPPIRLFASNQGRNLRLTEVVVVNARLVLSVSQQKIGKRGAGARRRAYSVVLRPAAVE